MDIAGIEVAVNYDLPDEEENYVHRVGGTGRAGEPGPAISFAVPARLNLAMFPECV